MPTGRKPLPSTVRDNKKCRKTKATLEAERAVEKICDDIPNDLTPPEDLTGEALDEWNKIVELYKNTSIKVLTNLDTAILRVHCDAIDRYLLAKNEWQKNCNKLIAHTDSKKQKYIDSLKSEMDKQGKVIQETSAALCLTVESRQRLAIINGKMAQKASNPLMKMFEDDED